jgi:hypothetical protein
MIIPQIAGFRKNSYGLVALEVINFDVSVPECGM